jgi:crotonobetaine/carnitine-CoA ligase
MVPRFIAFIDALPITVNKKVEKFKLRKAFEDKAVPVIDREALGLQLAR